MATGVLFAAAEGLLGIVVAASALLAARIAYSALRAEVDWERLRWAAFCLAIPWAFVLLLFGLDGVFALLEGGFALVSPIVALGIGIAVFRKMR